MTTKTTPGNKRRHLLAKCLAAAAVVICVLGVAGYWWRGAQVRVYFSYNPGLAVSAGLSRGIANVQVRVDAKPIVPWHKKTEVLGVAGLSLGRYAGWFGRGGNVSVRAWVGAGLAGAFLAVYPAVHFFRVIRLRRRLRDGLCLRCGYNLTGLPEPRCPECGTPISCGE